MALRLQLRRGTTTEHSSFTGAVGEVTVDTSRNTLVVHDGITTGGHPVTFDTVSQAEAEDGTSTTRRTWTSQRVRQAAIAAFDTNPSPVQMWYEMHGSRSLGVTYTNSTGKPIEISVSVANSSQSDVSLRCYINNSSVAVSVSEIANIALTIPNGAQYRLEGLAVSSTLWWELR